MSVDLPSVSIVVIGRNEEKNLNECFRSVLAIDYPKAKLEVIYVDTGSSDRSLEIAGKFNVKIVEERSDFPTPGLARNRGIQEAKNEVIHFVDGDMTVNRVYLKEAVSMLGKDNIACVIGGVSERRAHCNFFSRVLSHPWRSRKAGFKGAPGAGGTFLRNVLAELGGYHPEIRCGEETELGFRFIRAGYKIYMIDCEMGTHDYDVNTFFDLFMQSIMMGRSFGKILTLPPMPSYRDLRRRAKNIVIQGMLALAIAFLLVAVRQPMFLLAIPVILAIYVMVRYRREYIGQWNWYALLYYMFMHLCKPLVFCGVLLYLICYLIRKFLIIDKVKGNYERDR